MTPATSRGTSPGPLRLRADLERARVLPLENAGRVDRALFERAGELEDLDLARDDPARELVEPRVRDAEDVRVAMFCESTASPHRSHASHAGRA
ncbi:MAG TPA: hypothetical protein VK393_07670 [Nocardioidaceae bacterium]|nr:hypothetical protein [Nocardioidaceae bacterium]